MFMKQYGSKDISFASDDLAYLIGLVNDVFFGFCKAIVFV